MADAAGIPFDCYEYPGTIHVRMLLPMPAMTWATMQVVGIIGRH